MQADFKAKEDAESASKIDPKHALITLVAGLTVRYYLMDIIKVMVILAILLGDASFVIALFTRQAHLPFAFSPLKHRLCTEHEEVCTVIMLRMVMMFKTVKVMDIACCAYGSLPKLHCSSCEALLSVG